MSEYILKEYDDKIDEKWPVISDKLKEQIRNSGFRIIKSTDNSESIIRDEKDNSIIADARAHHIDAILTQDNDFLEAEIDYPAIVSVTEMWEYLKN